MRISFQRHWLNNTRLLRRMFAPQKTVQSRRSSRQRERAKTAKWRDSRPHGGSSSARDPSRSRSRAGLSLTRPILSFPQGLRSAICSSIAVCQAYRSGSGLRARTRLACGSLCWRDTLAKRTGVYFISPTPRIHLLSSQAGTTGTSTTCQVCCTLRSHQMRLTSLLVEIFKLK